MYKVFIENIPFHVIDAKDFIPKDAIVIYLDQLESLKKPLFSLLYSPTFLLPIYLVSSSPKETFFKLFEGYDFVEAAGGIVKRKDTFLFIKRNGFWDIPKGKLDENELPHIAAVREIEEECGILNPKIENELGVTYHTYTFKGRPTLKKTYWYGLTYDGSKNLQGQLEEGITKVKWFKKEELGKIRKNTFASILEVMNLYFDEKEETEKKELRRLKGNR